ncbi:FAD-dependent oxidoreductase [Yeosuana sp. MJ-SS3]|uniref:FAD-dependent oxidoreductase n=1 Tax=Gilvirhabdus luticola TaxID=3079858 RepID=A0ABU3U5P0_9FLAO|nr:FAD-dependent oxidoreductase [Yeosuana sp. MJ-SS3]MDU8885715.1 FAD-dependent oxidoreductase [Yeosuana sp. MJ-SS3]
MRVDYIIVGYGLAGISFCEILKANNKSFIVFDNQSQQSSLVAGGLYNPVILKRFTPVWKCREQLAIALPMYESLEKQLEKKLDYKIPVLRRFASTQEQNNWFIASDKPTLNQYLSIKIIKNNNSQINAPFGLGKVLKTGRIDTQVLVSSCKEKLLEDNKLVENEFHYDRLKIGNSIQYLDIEAHNIVFAEGYGVKKNPFFNSLPLKQSKGELLTISAQDLHLDYVLKSDIFILPIGNNFYSVGSTYEWEDDSNMITKKAREELEFKLKKVLTCSYKVVNQLAGIRPTVIDRRPLVGKHAIINNMFVLNGLGTRGVMIGPYVANELYNFIQYNKPLDKEINIDRFN